MKRIRQLYEELFPNKDFGINDIDFDIDIEKIKKTVIRKIDLEGGAKKRINYNKYFVRAASSAAAFALLGAVIMNISPKTAKAFADIPVIKRIVNVVTLGRYEFSENGYEADIVTPKIEGLLDKDLEKAINKEFADNANALISAYENDVRTLKEEFGDETVHMGVKSDYQVKTDNDKILALDVYIFYTAGSSSTKHTYYNIDKAKNKLITLESLFYEDADFITPVSSYIKEQMKYENEHNNGLFWIETDEFTEGFKGISKEQKFYIDKNDNLVICFDKYEIAAGAQGCPEFVIPREIIKDVYKGF